MAIDHPDQFLSATPATKAQVPFAPEPAIVNRRIGHFGSKRLRWDACCSSLGERHASKFHLIKARVKEPAGTWRQLQTLPTFHVNRTPEKYFDNARPKTQV